VSKLIYCMDFGNLEIVI